MGTVSLADLARERLKSGDLPLPTSLIRENHHPPEQVENNFHRKFKRFDSLAKRRQLVAGLVEFEGSLQQPPSAR